MGILPELQERRSYRALSPEPIEKDVLTRLLVAATLAPSCFNNQPWRMIVIEKAHDNPLYQLVAATLNQGNAWALEAPALISFATAAHLDCRLDEGRDYAYFDVGQAVMALQIQAQAEGLFAHVLAGYSASKLRRILKLPQEYVPLCVLALGWPGDETRLPENLRVAENSLRSRKNLNEVAFSGTFDTPWS